MKCPGLVSLCVTLRSYASRPHATPGAAPQLPAELSRIRAPPPRPAPSSSIAQWALGRGLLSWPPPRCGLERRVPASAPAERPPARAAMGTVHARVGERRAGWRGEGRGGRASGRAALGSSSPGDLRAGRDSGTHG